MNYNEKLTQKEWQDKSHRIKTRDNLKCQAFDCTTPNSILQVHHLDYLHYNKPSEYPDDMLITLCKECHKKENTRYLLEGRLWTCFKMKGFLYGDLLALNTRLYTDQEFVDYILKELRKQQNG